tara:strand:+ start:1338 stop:1670 length:333 start_codon:yes stop_codon:yes gene_type:complete
MSHVPLLSRQGVPKLQPTRRGPLVVCLCLLAGLVCLITPSSTYAHVFENLTRATHALPVKPPPEAFRRILEYTKRFPYDTFERGEPGSEDIQQDLIHAVAHLVQQEMNPR